MAALHGSEHVGHVSQRRWQQLVDECREAIEAQTRVQWQLGDAALEIEPIRAGGASPSELEPGVAETLGLFAEEIGIELSTLQQYRSTAAHWPKKCRRKHVSFSVHLLLNGLPDRCEVIADPPVGDDGKRRWTYDQARRRAGQQVHYPHEPDECLTRVRSLTREPEVASTAAQHLISQPEVVEHLVSGPSTWHTLSATRRDHQPHARPSHQRADLDPRNRGLRAPDRADPCPRRRLPIRPGTRRLDRLRAGPAAPDAVHPATHPDRRGRPAYDADARGRTGDLDERRVHQLATWMNAQFTSLSRTIEITLSPPGGTGRTPTPA